MMLGEIIPNKYQAIVIYFIENLDEFCESLFFESLFVELKWLFHTFYIPQ